MTINHITYRDDYTQPWVDVSPPGPMPQAYSRDYPTARTYCTCGHVGPSHRRQTLTTGPYSQAAPLRYRGDCQVQVRRTTVWGGVEWYTCPCTWFVEQMPRDDVVHGVLVSATDDQEDDGMIDIGALLARSDAERLEKARRARVNRLARRKNGR